jgi:hypothetical protein
MSVAGNPKHNPERESMSYPWVLCVLFIGSTLIAALPAIRRRFAPFALYLPVVDSFIHVLIHRSSGLSEGAKDLGQIESDLNLLRNWNSEGDSALAEKRA